MKAEYIAHMGTDLSSVNAARVSMDKESNWVWDKGPNPELVDEMGYMYDGAKKVLKLEDAKLITYLAKNRHDSCFEHQTVTLRLKVPLFVRSQIHRHRTFAYNEVSRRYVKDNLEFYYPEKWRKAAANVKQGSLEEQVEENVKAHKTAWWVVNHSVMAYEALIKEGVCAEQARMILPQNLYTQFYMTGNLRNWAHFLKLRLDPHAQREVQEIAKQCAALIEPLFPISYGALMNV